ncbi:glycerol ethanol, ferric requiring protein, partial [Linderina macrospora]
MGCCVGNVVSRNFSKYRRNYARQREIISAAAAAGVAVAFGSPIGGVLFSLEDLSSHFPLKTMWRSFFCALIATVSLQAMNPFRTGKLVMFQATYDRDWHFFEIVFFVILGIFGGIYGGICIRLNLKVTAFRKKYLAQHVVREVAVLALATTAITFTNKYTRQDMGELLAYLLRECKQGDWGGICEVENSTWVIWGLLMATLIRAAGTVCAYGCKIPCGIFVPSMAVGATFGRMLGIIAQSMHRAYPKSALFSQCAPDTPCITPATYAFLGAAAALCGVTKVTVAVVVIMYELTGALNFILPTVIVVMVARVIGDAIVEGGISEQLILLNGLPFFDEEDDLLDIPVASVMRMDMHMIPASGIQYSELRQLLDDTQNIKGFPVVDNTHDVRLVGYVQRDALVRALLSVRTGDEATLFYFGGSSSGESTIETSPYTAEAMLDGESQRPSSTINLSGLVNTSPVTVSPRTAAETVL